MDLINRSFLFMEFLAKISHHVFLLRVRFVLNRSADVHDV